MDTKLGWDIDSFVLLFESCKRNKTLRRAYCRKIAVEKLRLAERGINQDKIAAVCCYLINKECMRGYNLKSCRDLVEQN